MSTTLKTPVSESTATGAMADAGSCPEVSVVIPCLNEGQSIAACVAKAVEAFRNSGIHGEVVVADNGSTDGSQNAAMDNGARVIHADTKGYGSALRCGIAEARGSFIILGDADRIHDFSEVPITMWPDQRNRPPHLRTFRDGWRHLRFIMLSAPNWLFLLPGGLLTSLGIGLVLWLLPGPAFAGRVELNTNTMSLAMMLVLLGVHIFSIGLFVKVF